LSDADHLQPLTVILRMPRPPVGMAWPSASSRAERSTLGALLDQPFIAVRIDLRWGFCRDRTSSLLQAALRLAAACKMEEILFGAGYPGWRSRTRSELGYLISARWASGYTTADSFIEGPKSRFAGRTRPAYRARSRVRRVSKAEAPKRIRTSDPRQRRNGRREQGESSFLLSAPEGESTAQPRELRHRLGKKLSEKFSL